MNCPKCNYKFEMEFRNDEVGCTVDCPACDKLLIVTITLEDFNEHMHKKHSEWPSDGKKVTPSLH